MKQHEIQKVSPLLFAGVADTEIDACITNWQCCYDELNQRTTTALLAVNQSRIKVESGSLLSD